MPLDAAHHWQASEMVTAGSHAAQRTLRSTPVPAGSVPAERFFVDGGPATVGIIARRPGALLRRVTSTLTADGQVRNCLFANAESDLRTPLRAGAKRRRSWPELIRGEMWRKARGHGIGSPDFHQPTGRCPPSAADRGLISAWKSPGGRRAAVVARRR